MFCSDSALKIPCTTNATPLILTVTPPASTSAAVKPSLSAIVSGSRTGYGGWVCRAWAAVNQPLVVSIRISRCSGSVARNSSADLATTRLIVGGAPWTTSKLGPIIFPCDTE